MTIMAQTKVAEEETQTVLWEPIPPSDDGEDSGLSRGAPGVIPADSGRSKTHSSGSFMPEV